MRDSTPLHRSIPADPIHTHVPNLDRLIDGGLPRGGLILIMGFPGSGKSTLAQQIAFSAPKQGEKVLILTAISEPVEKLIEHVRPFQFFDASLIGGAITIYSLQVSPQSSIASLCDQILATASQTQPSLVVIDGFRGLQNIDPSPGATSQFLYEVGTTLGSLGITTVITSESNPRSTEIVPETITADILIGLHYGIDGLRQWRGIEVVKARGIASIPGIHCLNIDQTGAHIYLQLEERLGLYGDRTPMQATPDYLRRLAVPESPARATFDLPELDALINGGIPKGTSTILAGGSGTGKTLLSTYFALAGAREHEPVLFFSFRETIQQLLAKTAAFTLGYELHQRLLEDRYLTHIHYSSVNANADVVAECLVEAIERTGAKRVVIDSLGELERCVLRSRDPERLAGYLAALVELFDRYQATAIVTKETNKILATSLDFDVDPISATAENVLFLQQITHGTELVRVLSVLKMRRSAYQNGLREFRIAAPSGVSVLPLEESPGERLERFAFDRQ
jgi:circadian clock protein KaiC